MNRLPILAMMAMLLSGCSDRVFDNIHDPLAKGHLPDEAFRPEKPSIVPPGKAYQQSVEVQLTHPLADVAIRYTLDGQDPDLSSPLYGAPLVLKSSAKLKARAFKKDVMPSEVASETYAITKPGDTSTAYPIWAAPIANVVTRYDYNGERENGLELDATVKTVTINSPQKISFNGYMDNSGADMIFESSTSMDRAFLTPVNGATLITLPDTTIQVTETEILAGCNQGNKTQFAPGGPQSYVFQSGSSARVSGTGEFITPSPGLTFILVSGSKSIARLTILSTENNYYRTKVAVRLAGNPVP